MWNGELGEEAIFRANPFAEAIVRGLDEGEALIRLDRGGMSREEVSNYIQNIYKDLSVFHSYKFFTNAPIGNFSFSGDTIEVSLKRDQVLRDKKELTEAVIEAAIWELDLMNPDLSEPERILRIHDYIVHRAEYDIEGYRSDNIGEDSYTAYGILCKRLGVCSGYARAFQMFCSYLEIPCVYIEGMANGRHAWNKVLVAGAWYNIDLTWDDPVDYIHKADYDYFLKSDREMGASHREDENRYYPRALEERDFVEELNIELILKE